MQPTNQHRRRFDSATTTTTTAVVGDAAVPATTMVGDAAVSRGGGINGDASSGYDVPTATASTLHAVLSGSAVSTTISTQLQKAIRFKARVKIISRSGSVICNTGWMSRIYSRASLRPARYPSVKGAKVVLDTNTGCSKGYGFVRFADENERTRAMNEMNGQYCSSRPMRVGVATPKKPPTQQQYGQQQYPSQAVLLTGGNDSYGAVPQSEWRFF
ncbi:hypothetical protein R6Q59_012804 [Mikania micrantha]